MRAGPSGKGRPGRLNRTRNRQSGGEPEAGERKETGCNVHNFT